MKKFLFLAVLVMMGVVTGLTSCGDDWQEERSHWASRQIGGVWESPNTDGAKMPDGRVADRYELSIIVHEERGVMTNYYVAKVLGENRLVSEYGYMGHPNGKPDNVIDCVNKTNGASYRFTFEWGNSTRTQFEFGGRTWTKTDREPW